MTPGRLSEVSGAFDELYRAHYGGLVGYLVRVAGAAQLELAELAVQDAFAQASGAWGVQPPEHALAWLRRVARNRLIDLLRKEKVRSSAVELAAAQTSEVAVATEPLFSREVADDQLRMLFVACHPELTKDEQVTVALKVLCGVELSSVAALFLTTKETARKRYTRALQKLRAHPPRSDTPPAAELEARLEAVCKILFVLFAEGHKARSGDEPLNRVVCGDAIRLVEQLLDHDGTQRPFVHGLAALMKFQASRLDARTDDAGHPVLLHEQDRKRWNQRLIDEALRHLGASAQGSTLHPYHLQAAIAACHALAPTFDDTPWSRIIRLYDQLIGIEASDVLELNRALAIGFRDGPIPALELLDGLAGEQRLGDFFPYHVARGYMLERAGEIDAAREAYSRGLEHCRNSADERYLETRMAGLGT